MVRIMLKSKIHRATVTESDLNYIGSLTIDVELLASADILPNEQICVVNVTNGQRFETYAVPGEAGEMKVNGAAARLVHVGDTIIVFSYAHYDEAELLSYAPRVVHVDETNGIVTVNDLTAVLIERP